MRRRPSSRFRDEAVVPDRSSLGCWTAGATMKVRDGQGEGSLPALALLMIRHVSLSSIIRACTPRQLV